MTSMDIKEVDLYELLGLLSTCTTQEVKKAYRKKALSCHPDKNPDNPRAAELFHELSKALEILTDESARAAYDKVLNAKKAAKLRHRELDSKRRKLKEELEARERKAEEAAKKYRSFDTRTDEEKLQAEIDRLRKEGSKQVKAEQEYVQQEILREKLNPKHEKDSNCQCRLKIRWDAEKDDPNNGGYNQELLQNIFSKYGEIAVLIVSVKKKGSALIEFTSANAALTARELERGLAKNPLRVENLDSAGQKKSSDTGRGPQLADLESGNDRSKTGSPHGIFPSMDDSTKKKPSSTFPSFSFNANISNVSQQSDSDFENLVLRRMRQAEERKKLIDKMKEEDESETQ